MQTELIFSQEDFLVNHTQVQESDLEKKMTATSGRKCSERLKKFNHVGLWAKTFTDLLIGQEGWFSTKCRLTWSLKGTKYSRIYCQLAPSTLHTEEIGYGLLPTPTCQDAKQKENSPSQQHKLSELAIRVAGGSGSQLSPQFVMEMMGFPTDWTLLPFLNGETSQSKQEEMQ